MKRLYLAVAAALVLAAVAPQVRAQGTTPSAAQPDTGKKVTKKGAKASKKAATTAAKAETKTSTKKTTSKKSMKKDTTKKM